MAIRVKQFIAIILALLFLFLGVFIWGILTDGPPQFFPLDNPQGKYLVTKNCPLQGWQDNPRIQGNLYCIMYSGEGVLLAEENRGNVFTVMVGKSDIDLNRFEDKYVTNIKGAFVNSSKQCIVNTCSIINGPHAVLNIYALEAVN